MKIIGIGIVAYFLMMLQRLVYKRYWDRNLHISVAFSQNAIYEGQEGTIVEVIENRKRLPLPMLKVKFQTSRNLGFWDDKGSKTTDQYYRNDIFQVGAEEKITRTLRFRGNKRGYYRIHNIDYLASDLFFKNEMGKSETTNSYLYVYPTVFSTDEFHSSLQKLNGEIIVKRHMIEDPFEYRGIREYQPFDDIRSVNWKATARTGALKVNQKAYTAMQTIRIFINLEDDGIWRKDREIESSMQMAMGIASFFLAQGIQVSCYTNGRDILTDAYTKVEHFASREQIEVLGKVLARIDTEKKSYSFVDLFQEEVLTDKDGFFTFFISPNGYADFIDLLEKCNEKRLDYCWYYPVASSEKPDLPKEIEAKVRVMHFI